MSDQAANLTASGLFTTSAGAFNSTLPVIMVCMSTSYIFGLDLGKNSSPVILLQLPNLMSFTGDKTRIQNSSPKLPRS